MTTSSHRLSDKLTAIAVLFMLVALAAVGITLYVAWQLEGGAAAVNAMGSQRMRSYHIGMLLAERAARPAAEAELSAAILAEAAAFERTLAEVATGRSRAPASHVEGITDPGAVLQFECAVEEPDASRCRIAADGG